MDLPPPKVGIFEINRLNKLLISFSKEGYQPEIHKDGYVRGILLKQNNDSRFLIYAGAHRLAVLKALGYKWITAKLQPVKNNVVNRDDAPNWPQVKNNLYSLQQALNYFDGLFKVTGKPIGEIVQSYSSKE